MSILSKLDGLITGSASQADLLNRKFDRLIEAVTDQTRMLSHQTNSLIAETAKQNDILNRKLDALAANVTEQSNAFRCLLDKAKSDAALRRVGQRYLYFARIEHPNDAVNAENVLEYCSCTGIPAREIIIKSDGAGRSELRHCLPDALAIVSTNWHLDHSCVDDLAFPDLAAEAGIPVIHWILDHPSARWPEFAHSTAHNSRFLFESAYSESYFRRYIMPACQSAWTVATGPNRASRVAELTRPAFLARDFHCMVPLNLKRLAGTPEEIEQKRQSLPAGLRAAVTDAIETAYLDLQDPIEAHLLSACPSGRLDDPRLLHHCVHLVEDSVQQRRRFKVFEIAQEFPVLLQSDGPSLQMSSDVPAFLDHDIALTATLRRMPRSRAVLSLSHVNDQLHNRTLNGLNAGCVNIIEDNKAHRQFFSHGTNALLFRYGDDSLREALELVCSSPSTAFKIAEAGFALRDDPRLRFGGFHNFISLAQ